MLRALFLVAFGIAALSSAAPAVAGTVGVVVTGEVSMQPALVSQVEGWLRSHGHQIVAHALDAPSTTRLSDCFTVDDGACARKVVETMARAESIVFVRATREGASLSLTVHWIVKGRPPAGSRRGCEPCTEDALRGAADDLMTSLAPSVSLAQGRLKLTSTPPGMIVMLDGVKIGVTPIERDLAAGTHTISLFEGNTRVGEREIKIDAGASVEVTMPVVYPDGRPIIGPVDRGPSRLLPILCWAGGGVLIAGGAVSLYYGSKDGPDEKYIYKGATPAGIALAGAGAASIGVGVWLWLRGSRTESTPVAAIAPGGGYFGWSGRF